MKCAVIGAGISGLACAFELMEAGHDVTVFEKSRRVGGNIRTRIEDGYVVEWGPERIDMFVDDTLYFSYLNEHKGWREWPYDHPFHLIINLAIGGDWGRAGGPIDDTLFPQRLLVDYVRVYRLAE